MSSYPELNVFFEPDSKCPPLFAAPMASVSDRAFRHICIDEGARLTYTEMISAAGLIHMNKRGCRMLARADNERYLAVQLFGSEPELMAQAALKVQELLGEALVLIDVNMGCPMPKLVRKKEGGALMRDVRRATAIIEAMIPELSVPVTAKFRSGQNSHEINALSFAQALQAAGAAAIAVHPRSVVQRYTGRADWSLIAAIKKSVHIKVIGSGDVFFYQDACNMSSITGVDAVMVARGARGNPWIFSGTIPSVEQRLLKALRHLELYVHYEGRRRLSPMRSQLSFYIKGLPGAAAMRAKLMCASELEDYKQVFIQALENIDSLENIDTHES